MKKNNKFIISKCTELLKSCFDQTSILEDTIREIIGLIENHEGLNWLDLHDVQPVLKTMGEDLMDFPQFEKILDSHNPFHQILKTYYCYRCVLEPGGPRYEQASLIPFLEEVDSLISQFEKENTVDYYDPKFRKLRLQVFLRDGEVCAKCGTAPSPGISLTVDHIKPVSLYPDLFYNLDNLQVLCWKCNQEKSNRNSIDYRKDLHGNPNK